MPIIGLTNRGPSFPQIGILRKGAVKGTNTPGKDLKHFRLDTKLADVQAAFEAVYGKEPVSVRVFLPYQTPAQNFEAWREEYTASSLIHRCDGQTMTIWRTPDGKYEQGSKPCPYMAGTTARTKAKPGCKPVGRLKVIVPELQRLAYVLATTTSIHDIIELTGNLEAAYALHSDLRGIPFILRRAPRMISMPKEDGSRVRVEKWLLFLEPAPDWVSLQLSAMSHAALPIVEGEYNLLPAPQTMALASGVVVDLNTGEVTSDEDEDDEEEPEPPAPPAPKPMSPAELQGWLRTIAKASMSEPELTTGWRDGILGTIDKMTEPNGHHALLKWAFGNSTGSRKALTNGQIHALKAWLQTHSVAQIVNDVEKKVWVLNDVPLAELMAAYPIAKDFYALNPDDIPAELKEAVANNADSLHA